MNHHWLSLLLCLAVSVIAVQAQEPTAGCVWTETLGKVPTSVDNYIEYAYSGLSNDCKQTCLDTSGCVAVAQYIEEIEGSGFFCRLYSGLHSDEQLGDADFNYYEYTCETGSLRGRAEGDPHIVPLGATKSKTFKGSCWHILLTDIGCPDGGKNTFEVLIKFHRRDPRKKATYVTALRINYKVDGKTTRYDFGHGHLASFTDTEGKQALITRYPFHQPNIVLSRRGHRLIAELKLEGLHLTWNGVNRVDYTFKSGNPVCGLGGSENAKQQMLVGPHDVTQKKGTCPGKASNLKQGSWTDKNYEVEHSWYIRQDDEDEYCLKECRNI